MKSAIVMGTIGLGFALLAASLLWTTIFPPTRSWTPEKAKRMSDVKERLNNLSFVVNAPRQSMQKGGDPGVLKAECETLMKEFDQLKSDFESAAESPKTISSFLKWSGISLACLGLIGWYAVNQSR